MALTPFFQEAAGLLNLTRSHLGPNSEMGVGGTAQIPRSQAESTGSRPSDTATVRAWALRPRIANILKLLKMLNHFIF